MFRGETQQSKVPRLGARAV
ncbi:Protein of unknown function [Gryllus bimaculatus]|nr:Protein of unknown function [Gryllus bimaculatus]